LLLRSSYIITFDVTELCYGKLDLTAVPDRKSGFRLHFTRLLVRKTG
jgi:hypothetical protein